MKLIQVFLQINRFSDEINRLSKINRGRLQINRLAGKLIDPSDEINRRSFENYQASFEINRT